MCCSFYTILLLAVLYYLIKNIYRLLLKIPDLPKMDESFWWGPVPAKPTEEDTSIYPFKINVSNQVLADLKQRLQQSRPFTAPLEETEQQYGMNSNLLKEVLEFWKSQYNWREAEEFLNKFPQYTTTIQGLQLHFLHVKPKEASGLKVLPLLLLHGWPGSVREFYEAIPLLIAPQKDKDFVFEVIVPSLPGYGFSEAAVRPGLGAAEVAVVFKNFMTRLGFDKYYVQGGDWGAAIGTHMGTLYPDHVLGLHVNMTNVYTPLAMVKLMVGRFFPGLIVPDEHKRRVYPLSRMLYLATVELGYMHIQATKPDTIGAGLNDSPAGLAAYILEKFTTWTDRSWQKREDGGLTLKFSYTKLLDNIMIYWITGSITTSMRLYAETLNTAQRRLKLDRIPVRVPSACARFKTDMFYQPNIVLREKYRKLLQISDFSTGGHFVAFEEPQLFADDVWSAVEEFQAHHLRNQDLTPAK